MSSPTPSGIRRLPQRDAFIFIAETGTGLEFLVVEHSLTITAETFPQERVS